MVFLVAGCATSLTDDIKLALDNYKTVVFNDGIELEESKIIAQKQLIKRNLADIYGLSNPHVDNDVSDLPNHEDYWFIYFEENKPSSIPFIFMVLVDKKKGKIKFADDYNEGNKWILEATLLR